MNSDIRKSGASIFESIKHSDDRGEFWYGRELGDALGYTNWRTFNDVIQRAKVSIKKTGMAVENHFEEVLKVVLVGYGNTTEQKVPDVRLTRYACYIIAQNGNPTIKPLIAEAQSYFAVQTRRREIAAEHEQDMARLARRQEFSESDKRLSSNIMEAGVSNRGLANIKNEGDKVFFGGKSSKKVKEILGTGNKPWANKASNVVLAGKTLANEMTAANIENYGITSYGDVLNDNNDNNGAVRKTIGEQQGTYPEEFSPAEDTDNIKKRIARRDKGLLE